MMERRRSKRLSFTYYMRVTDSNTDRPVGHISDVTVQGFKIDSTKPVPVGTTYNLRLELTNEVSNKNYMIFTARAKWCCTDRLDPFIYNVGFEIVSITPEDGAIYQRIVEKYAAHAS